MPEAPEVEVVVRQLKPLLTGASIVGSRSNSQRFITPPLLTIKQVHRHGKWIVLTLIDDAEAPQGALLINLGMSGRFVLGMERPKHVRWEILLQPASIPRLRALRYVDPRSFGRLVLEKGIFARQILHGTALAKGAPLLGLGPDLMSKFMMEGDLDTRVARWRHSLDTSIPIKRALLDQSRLAGLGNIYASEACWIGRVNPERPACDVTRTELRKMAEGVPRMLRRSVYAGGTSFGDANSYRDSKGIEGKNAANLKVYGRAGLNCSCGGTIAVTRNGRATFFCTKCQI